MQEQPLVEMGARSEPRPAATELQVGPHGLTSWLPLAAGILWGTSFPATGLALTGFESLAVAFWRAVIGCLSLGAWLLWRSAFTGRPSAVQWSRLVALSLAGAGLFWPLLVFSVQLSNPVNSAFLVGTYPAVAAATAPLFLGEKARARNFIGLGLAVVGGYLVISKGHPLDLFASSTLKGDALALLASASFGTYIILGQKWRGKLGVSTEEMTFYTFALSLPVLAVLAVVSGPLITTFDPGAIGGVLWLGLMASTGAFLALNQGLKNGAVARGSLHLMVIPVVAAVVSWLLFGTSLAPAQWIGGALVVIGIGMSR
jgi:drug/metabolite transporter (DMT)-like permease